MASPYLERDAVLSRMAAALRDVSPLKDPPRRLVAYAEAGIGSDDVRDLDEDAVSLERVRRRVMKATAPVCADDAWMLPQNNEPAHV